MVVRRLLTKPCVRALGEDDAFGVGQLTLTRCAKCYDPFKGYAFSTYACFAIRCDILRAASIHNRAGKRLPDDFDLIEEVDDEIDLELVAKLLERLNPRGRQVISLYYGLESREPMLYKDVGKLLEVSDSRAQQIATKAIREMRR
jgi:RNA polymerase sigma factor (sigma-70 family)